MVDVSDIFILTSILAEQGAEGAALLRKGMKGYMGKLIQLILKND